MSSVDPVVRLLADLDRPARPAVEFQDALLARLLGQLEDAFHHEPEARAHRRVQGRGARVLRPLGRRPGRMALALRPLPAAAIRSALRQQSVEDGARLPGRSAGEGGGAGGGHPAQGGDSPREVRPHFHFRGPRVHEHGWS